MKHFGAIVAMAESLGWPEAYRDDLYKHDREALENWPEDKPFAWSIRNTGTWMILPTCKHEHEWAKAVARNSESSRFYVWDGSRLREVNAATWLECVWRWYSKLPEWQFSVTFHAAYCRPWTEYRKAKADTAERAKAVIESDLGRSPPHGCTSFTLQVMQPA